MRTKEVSDNQNLWKLGGQPEISGDAQCYVDAIAEWFSKARMWIATGFAIDCENIMAFSEEQTHVSFKYSPSDYDLKWVEKLKEIENMWAQHMKEQIFVGSNKSNKCPCCGTDGNHVNGKVAAIDGLQWMYCFTRGRGKGRDNFHRWFTVAGVVDDVALCPLCIYSGRTLFYGMTYEEVYLGLLKELKECNQEVYLPLLFVLSYRQISYAWCNHTMDYSKLEQLLSWENKVMSYEHASASQIFYSATSFIEVGSVFTLCLTGFDYQQLEIVDLLRWYSGCMAYMFYSSKTFGDTHSHIDWSSPGNINGIYDKKRLKNLELFALYFSNIRNRLPIELLQSGLGMMSIPWTMDRYINRLDGYKHAYVNCHDEVKQGIEAFKISQLGKAENNTNLQSITTNSSENEINISNNNTSRGAENRWKQATAKLWSRYSTWCKNAVSPRLDAALVKEYEKSLAHAATLKEDNRTYIGKTLEEHCDYKTHENDHMTEYCKRVRSLCCDIGMIVEEIANNLSLESGRPRWPGNGDKINFNNLVEQSIRYVDGPAWNGYFRDTPYLIPPATS